MKEYMSDLLKEYFASKEKLSKVIEKQENYANQMMDKGFSPSNNPLQASVIELLQFIDNSANELLCKDDLDELDRGMMNDSLLHIRSCVSNIRVKLGLPPSSFSKRCEYKGGYTMNCGSCEMIVKEKASE